MTNYFRFNFSLPQVAIPLEHCYWSLRRIWT